MKIRMRAHERQVGRDEREADVGRRPDEQRVEHGADAGPLAQRDPEQQHDDAREHGDDAEAQPGVHGDALREHVPRRGADLPAHDERDADPVEEEPDEQLREASRPRRRRGGGLRESGRVIGHIQLHDWPSHQ